MGDSIHGLLPLVLVLSLATSPLSISDVHAGDGWAEFTLTAQESTSVRATVLDEDGDVVMARTIPMAGGVAHRVLTWRPLEQGSYVLVLDANGTSVSYPFSVRRPVLSGFRVSSTFASSEGCTLVLSPTSTEMRLVDITFQLLVGHDGVYEPVEQHTNTSIPVAQPTVVHHRWRSVLADGREYAARMRVSAHGEGIMASYIVPFTARMDAEISEVYADEDGVSITVQGRSMVPLDALVEAEVSNATRTVRESTPCPYITLSSDSVDVMWSERLSPGRYGVVVRILSHGEELDRFEGVLEVEQRARPSPPPATPASDGMGVLLTALGVLIALLLRRS